MPRTNINAVRIKPEVSELLTLRVRRSERISSHFQRVTLGEGDIERFHPMGYDQWFRLFIPVSDDSLSRLPAKLNTLAYLRYLTAAQTMITSTPDPPRRGTRPFPSGRMALDRGPAFALWYRCYLMPAA